MSKIYIVIIKQKPEKHGILSEVDISLRKEKWGAHHIETQTKGPLAQNCSKEYQPQQLSGKMGGKVTPESPNIF